ncbi:serine protease [[Flexibacter] sp. ATCC 35208]|uniref:S1 family peptidase n=1 Tax=[Flexibacter] sp. ATCC 35208 TaxID=1936242 RepID=UPI0009C53BBF|nr:serine protease [[Flexibacter] sp. ATCC 35208]OMP75124.1 hypothetical protein BW716_31835 [[Flexibacter] sp. ATCC 35208]
MKVVSNSYLNARVGAPSITTSNPSWLRPGDEIDIDSVGIGDTIEGNSIWYHATNNCYYWSGGIDNIEFEFPGADFSTLTAKEAVEVAINLKNFLFDRYYKKNYITGIGVGYKNDEPADGICMTFLVSQKTDQVTLIPEYFLFKGYRIPTDVKLSASAKTHHYDPTNKERCILADQGNPVHCGGRVLNGDKEICGTRTLFISKDEINYMLTCFHVVAMSEIVDSTDYFFGDLQAKKILFSASGKPFQVSKGALNSFFDYALTEITHQDMDNKFPHPFFTNTLIVDYYRKDELELGLRLYSFGATSGPQTGIINHVSFDVDLMAHDTIRSYKGLIRTTKISEPGDSGSPVVGVNGKLIGYVVGGVETASETDDTCSYLIPWYNVADQLDFKIINV